MNTIRLAIAQLEVSDGDYAGNFEKIARTVTEYGPNHDLIVLPETATSGFASRNDIERLAEPLAAQTVHQLKQWSHEYSVTIACGLAERMQNNFYNTAVVVSDGDLVFAYRKTHLWVNEGNIFSPGNTYYTAPWHGTELGALVCFDIEFPEPARAIATLGGGLLVVCDGNMAPYGPAQRTLAIARAIENQMFVAVANRVGQGRIDTFSGGSLIVGPGGDVIAEADGISETVLSTELDLTQIERAREHYDYLKLRRFRLSGETDTVGTNYFTLPDPVEPKDQN